MGQQSWRLSIKKQHQHNADKSGAKKIDGERRGWERS